MKKNNVWMTAAAKAAMFLVAALAATWMTGCDRVASFDKAQAAADAGNINFFGFYTGMPMEDAEKLAARHGLQFDVLIPEELLHNDKKSAFWVDMATDEVFTMFFTLKDIRQITKGPSTLNELAQVVANQVGDLEPTGQDAWKYETIDGVSLKIGKSGCRIHDAPRAKKARAQAVPALNEILRADEVRTPGETVAITLPGGAEMAMVWCPPGAFWMGSPVHQEGTGPYAEKQHLVVLTTGFWMAKTEVTQKQWQSVMGNNPSHFKGDDLPVENVSWDDAQEFCRKTGLQLPTEAQWEYACRAGTTGDYGGTGKLADMGWYDEYYYEQDMCGTGSTHPVGQKQPNAWGLYDMHGNVEEWCQDRFGAYPNHAVQDPQGDASGSFRVKRGGSWRNDAWVCRSTWRFDYSPANRSNSLGFRPASSVLP
jgi:formylglycine-generating enzyme required for sulfatase activity